MIGPIVLPIECQLQTIEQYKDGNVGYSAHSKMENKKPKLKDIPKTLHDTRLTDPTGNLEYFREFLYHIMKISPSCAIARTTGNDFESERTMITPFDLYEAFRLISRVPSESPSYRFYQKYLEELYRKRNELFPTGEELLPRYIMVDEIPNPNIDSNKYQRFLRDLRMSLNKTLSLVKSKENDENSNIINPNDSEPVER